jgi:hypothetical protein
MLNSQFKLGDKFTCNKTQQVLSIIDIYQEPDGDTDYTLSDETGYYQIEVCINALLIEYTQINQTNDGETK